MELSGFRHYIENGKIVNVEHRYIDGSKKSLSFSDSCKELGVKQKTMKENILEAYQRKAGEDIG